MEPFDPASTGGCLVRFGDGEGSGEMLSKNLPDCSASYGPITNLKNKHAILVPN